MNSSKNTNITLQGKVSASVLKKLGIESLSNKSCLWFFVDFASQTIQIPFTFDTLLTGESRSLIKTNSLNSIKILKAIDQYAHPMKEIPNGYKSICLIQFSPLVPKEIKHLPTLTQFIYNPESITLARHNDIQLKPKTDFITTKLYNVLYSEFKNEMQKLGKHHNTPHKRFVTKTVFYKFSRQKYKFDKANTSSVLNIFIQMGKVKTTKDEIELVEF